MEFIPSDEAILSIETTSTPQIRKPAIDGIIL